MAARVAGRAGGAKEGKGGGEVERARRALLNL